MKNGILFGGAALATIISGFFFCSPYKKKIVMIGHRGYSSKYMENTEQAFIAAAKHGSRGIETDVRITKDGKLVLSHNASVKFADGRTMKVEDCSLEELTSSPLKKKAGRKGGEAFLCTFDRYLEICREYDLIAFIELKGEFPDEKIKEAFSLAAVKHDLSKCSLQSFELRNLDKAHAMFPGLNIMLTYEDNDDGWRECIEKGYDIDIDYRFLSRKMIRAFHERGLKVGAWTANDFFTLSRLRWYDLDYIESDVF